jgi:hypothetical protein
MSMSLHARITRCPKGNLGAPKLPVADDPFEWVRPAWVPAPPVAWLSSPPASA